jgi:cell division initiation protein
MSLTPVEIRHVRLGRRPLGYDRRSTDRLLHEIAESFEDVWRERADLHDHVERLEAELGRARELEALLRNTLVSAERAADEMRAQARRESELVVEEARAKAREVVHGAQDERARVEAEIRRLRSLEAETRHAYRAFLASALERLDSETEPPAVSEQAA